jgi:hypothetical protein
MLIFDAGRDLFRETKERTHHYGPKDASTNLAFVQVAMFFILNQSRVSCLCSLKSIIQAFGAKTFYFKLFNAS